MKSWLGFLLLSILPSGIETSIDSYIVGGTQAKKCEFPHLAFLFIHKSGKTFSCGGSLLDHIHIVTAAHCVNNITSVQAMFGSVNVPNMRETIPVATYVKHSEFHEEGVSVLNDIAVLTLSRPVQFTPCRNAVRLIKPDEKIYSQCVIAGWGNTDFYSEPSSWLQRADIPIMPLGICAQMVQGITKQHVCAGDGTFLGNSACKGDSGGPLMCRSKKDYKFVLVGLISYGWTCREGLGVYTNVSYFKQWIEAQI